MRDAISSLYVLVAIALLRGAMAANTCTNDAIFNLTASSTIATFTSPSYPNGYPQNASCGWKIQAPPGKFVKLQFKDVLVECEDSILVYDGEVEKQDDLMNKLCMFSKGGTDAIYSYGNRLFVKFTSSSKKRSSFYKGFKAFYSAVDGGTICSPSNPSEINNVLSPSKASGNISSPGFPAVVPAVAFKCVWRLKAPIGHVFKLDVISVCLKVKFIYLNIHDPYPATLTLKTGLNSYELRSFQGDDYKTETVASDGQRLQVEYSQTSEAVKKLQNPLGFGAEYTSLPLDTTGSCSANQVGKINMKGEIATFHSLNYPNLHPYNMDCTWNITVTAGQVIELRFDTDLDSDCNKEWVRIYDGSTKSSPVIAKLCYVKHSYNHQPWYSSSNHVLVEFISRTRSKGFFATYIARMAAPKPYACSSSRTKLEGMQGKLASQNFPMSYANNVYCRWQIKVPFQHLAKITITSLDLQPDPKCSKDTLRVYGAGQFFIEVRLANLCGKRNTPLSFISKNREMTVEFFTDATERYPGFEANYEAIPDTSFGDCIKEHVDNIIPLSSSSGSFFTPRYPMAYPSNMKCTWQIRVPKGQLIRLSFQKFKLESCDKSYIEIRDGANASSKLLNKLCNSSSNPLIIFSSGSDLWVRFKSGSGYSYLSRDGFSAQYDAISQLPLSISCSEDVKIRKLKEPSGSIASYEYPLKYQNNIKCTWMIQTSSSKRFKIKFDTMDIEPSPGCKDDYVIIRDGGYSFSDSMGQFCGSSKPDTLTSSEDAIWVQFVSNGTGRYQGFKLSYETTYNVRTIVLISVFSVMGVLGLIVVIGWIVRCYLCASSSDEADVNMMDLKKESDD